MTRPEDIRKRVGVIRRQEGERQELRWCDQLYSTSMTPSMAKETGDRGMPTEKRAQRRKSERVTQPGFPRKAFLRLRFPLVRHRPAFLLCRFASEESTFAVVVTYPSSRALQFHPGLPPSQLFAEKASRTRRFFIFVRFYFRRSPTPHFDKIARVVRCRPFTRIDDIRLIISPPEVAGNF